MINAISLGDSWEGIFVFGAITMRHSKIWYAGALFCAAVFCTACSGTSVTANATPGGSPTPAATATKSVSATPLANLKAYCGLVSPAEISTSIGKSAPVAFPATVYTKGTVSYAPCGFGATVEQPVINIEFLKSVNGDSTAEFQALKSSFVSTTPIANLGDEAYLGTAAPAKDPELDIHFAVVVRKGTIFFFVGQFHDENAATVVPGDQKVAQLYLARM